MRAVVDAAQALRVHVAVDLRRRERGVAEELLDRAEIGPALEQVRRERVAEPVRVANEPADGARVESASPRGEEERVDRAARERRPCRREGSERRGARPPLRAARPAPCRPCRARGSPRARSRRRRGRARPPRRFAAPPSRGARAARDFAARAASRPRRCSRSASTSDGLRRVRQPSRSAAREKRGVRDARRTEREAQAGADGGDAAGDRRGCEPPPAAVRARRSSPRGRARRRRRARGPRSSSQRAKAVEVRAVRALRRRPTARRARGSARSPRDWSRDRIRVRRRSACCLARLRRAGGRPAPTDGAQARLGSARPTLRLLRRRGRARASCRPCRAAGQLPADRPALPTVPRSAGGGLRPDRRLGRARRRLAVPAPRGARRRHPRGETSAC